MNFSTHKLSFEAESSSFERMLKGKRRTRRCILGVGGASVMQNRTERVGVVAPSTEGR